MSGLADAVARKGDQPETTFAALCRIVQDTIGARLFTVTEFVPERSVAVRRYSNMPDDYPVSGEKPLQHNKWMETVLHRHETFVANSIEEIAEVFPDFELIQSLGCESCLNLPVVIAGELRATVNCLHDAGHYTPDRVVAADSLKPAAALAVLLALSLQGKDAPAG